MNILQKWLFSLVGADTEINHLLWQQSQYESYIAEKDQYISELKRNGEQLYEHSNELSTLCSKYSALIREKDEQILKLTDELKERKDRVQELALQVLHLSNVPSSAHLPTAKHQKT